MSQAVISLLEQIQLEMETLTLWQSTAPSQSQFQSSIPFCMDTMSFSQWLQWVYIGRLRAIIEAGGVLPAGAQVHPYAQESFKVEGIRSEPILKMIEQLDKLLA